MFFGSRKEEEKKRKQIRAYFTASKPTRGSRTDPQWIWEARLTGLIKFSDLVYKKGGFFRKERLEIPHDVFKKAKATRKEKMKQWGISERDVSSKPSSEQIDKWVQEDIEKIKQDALEHCRVSNLIMQIDKESMEPIVTPMTTPTEWIPSGDIALVIDRKEGQWRSSCYQITILMLGEDRFILYKGEYNCLRLKWYHVDNQQWWYSAINGFMVTEIGSSENYNLPDGQTITKGSILQMNLGTKNIKIFLQGYIQKTDVFENEEDESTIQDKPARMSIRRAAIHAILDQINEKKRVADNQYRSN